MFLDLFLWVFCLHVCMCTSCAHKDQKRVSFSLELGLRTDSCQPPCVCWASSLGPPHKQHVPLSAELSCPKGSFPVRNRLLVSYSKSKFKMLTLKLWSYQDFKICNYISFIMCQVCFLSLTFFVLTPTTIVWFVALFVVLVVITWILICLSIRYSHSSSC